MAPSGTAQSSGRDILARYGGTALPASSLRASGPLGWHPLGRRIPSPCSPDWWSRWLPDADRLLRSGERHVEPSVVGTLLLKWRERTRSRVQNIDVLPLQTLCLMDREAEDRGLTAAQHLAESCETSPDELLYVPILALSAAHRAQRVQNLVVSPLRRQISRNFPDRVPLVFVEVEAFCGLYEAARRSFQTLNSH